MSSRQALIPGVGYVNETGTRQANVPGQGYVNETVASSAGGGAVTIPPFVDAGAGTPKITGTGAVTMGAFVDAGAGQGGPVTSDCVTTVTDLLDKRIYQRAKGTTSKAIAVACTYTGTPSTIKFAAIRVSDSAVVATVNASSTSGGNASGTLTVPQGGPYNIQSYDFGNSGAASTGTHAWSVGILVCIMGQSNGVLLVDTSSTPPSPNTATSKFAVAGSGTTGSWATNTGNGSIRLANLLNDALGIPIGILLAAQSGSHMNLWQSPAGSAWTTMTLGANSIGGSKVGSDFEVGLWVHGEADSNVATVIDAATYKTGLEAVIANIQTFTGRSATQVGFGVALLGNCGYIEQGFPGTQATNQAIRQAQMEEIRDLSASGVFFAGSRIPDERIGGTDVAHTTGTYYERDAYRYAASILHWLFPGTYAYGSEGPAISRATRPAGSTDITLVISHNGGSALKEVDGTTDGASLYQGDGGFAASIDDFANLLTISSTAFVSGNIRLRLSSAPSDLATLKVRYLYGEMGDFRATSNIVFDDQTFDPTIGFPLQPTIGPMTVTSPFNAAWAGNSTVTM